MSANPFSELDLGHQDNVPLETHSTTHLPILNHVAQPPLGVRSISDYGYLGRAGSTPDVRSTLHCNNPYSPRTADSHYHSTPYIPGHGTLEGTALPSKENLGIPPFPSTPTIVIQPEMLLSEAASPDPAISPYGGECKDCYEDHATLGAQPVRCSVHPDDTYALEPRHDQALPASAMMKSTPNLLAGRLADHQEKIGNESEDALRRNGIRPIDTSHVERYSRGGKLATENTLKRLQPMTLDFDSLGPLPGDWVQYAHPEGALYYHEPARNIITDADPRDEEIWEMIEYAYAFLKEEEDRYPEFPRDTELVLEIPPESHTQETGARCYYYYVCHSKRILFWLNWKDAEAMCAEIQGMTRLSHMKTFLESEYWRHWEMFPLQRTVPDELLRELLGLIMHGGIDQLTSKVSTCPYKTEELLNMQEFVKNANYVQEMNGYSAWVVARMLQTFAYSRFLHFHGQPVARLSRDQPLYEDSVLPKTWLITIISPLLFFAPDVHLRHMEHIWVDRVMNEHPWKRFIERLQEEWDKFILPATVLLSANVAFLAIPSVDQTSQAPNFLYAGNQTTLSVFDNINLNTSNPSRSAAQIASYISVVASTGTIILGLILDRRHRSDVHKSAAQAANQLAARAHPKYGLETIAIIYALPYALLIWGMITFAAAWVFLFFGGTTLSTTIPVGTASTLCVSAIFWCMNTTWNTEYSWREQVVVLAPFLGSSFWYNIKIGMADRLRRLAHTVEPQEKREHSQNGLTASPLVRGPASCGERIV